MTPINVVFLDYDGVVNTPMWNKEGTFWNFNFPKDNKVNNFQAVQWVSEFCQKYNYSIVVTSSWRLSSNYAMCLVNGGLRQGIKILGKTKEIIHDHASRGEEIQVWLNNHPEVENFLIFDDEDDMGDLKDHLIKCDTDIGFGIKEFYRAEKMVKENKTRKAI